MVANGPEDRPRRLPTQGDVARLAGVSTATVSFVINDRTDQTISPETRGRVLDAVRALGYRPNRAARSLQANRTASIGFVSHETADNPFAGMSIAGAQDVAWRRGSALLMVNSARNATRLRSAIGWLLDHQVDAVLLAGVGTRRVTLPESFGAVPTILINCFTVDDEPPAVLPDDAQGGYDIARLLVDAGHRDIAVLAGVEGNWATRARVAGYRRAMADAGLDARRRPVRYGNYATDSGYRLTKEVLAEGRPPTALLCGNDRMALGAYLALGEAGLKIPSDISVVGYDDQAVLASEIQPPLTTVGLPYVAMGRWAAEQALAGTVADLPARTHLPCELVVRDSVAAVR